MIRFFKRNLSDDYDLKVLNYSLGTDSAGARRIVIEEWNDFGDSGRISPDRERTRDLSEPEFRSEFGSNPEIIAAFEQACRDHRP
jgi:hypothetical protein